MKPHMRPETPSPIIVEPLESENLSDIEERSGPDGFLSERLECIVLSWIERLLNTETVTDFILLIYNLLKLI